MILCRYDAEQFDVWISMEIGLNVAGKHVIHLLDEEPIYLCLLFDTHVGSWIDRCYLWWLVRNSSLFHHNFLRWFVFEVNFFFSRFYVCLCFVFILANLFFTWNLFLLRKCARDQFMSVDVYQCVCRSANLPRYKKTTSNRQYNSSNSNCRPHLWVLERKKMKKKQTPFKSISLSVFHVSRSKFHYRNTITRNAAMQPKGMKKTSHSRFWLFPSDAIDYLTVKMLAQRQQ